MSLKLEAQIRIDALLLKREVAFVRVYELESEIDQILGQPYPLPPPPEIPSSRKPGAKNGSRAKSARSGKKEVLKIEDLEGEEICYRLTYCQDGEVTGELHEDRNALEQFLQRPLASIQALKLETVNRGGQPLRCIWKSDSFE